MVITVCNFKGGVGKTTTCHALATVKGLQGDKVLCIDLDMQHSLTTSCGINVNSFDDNTLTISDLFMAEVENINYDISDIKETIIHLENIDLIPSTIKLNLCDKILSNSGKIIALDNILTKIKGEYDYIFLDCPPSNSTIINNALISSDSVIIPVESYFLGSDGLYEFINTLDEINNAFKTNIYIEGIILTMYQKTKICKSIKEYVFEAIHNRNLKASELSITNSLKNTNIKIFEEVIPRSIRVVEASICGKSIVEYQPQNPVSQQYIKIASQIGRKEKILNE